MNQLNILVINKHWLHSYDLNMISFNVLYSSFSHDNEDTTLIFVPRLVHGYGGLAILVNIENPLFSTFTKLRMTELQSNYY